jgi:hypothetical protein
MTNELITVENQEISATFIGEIPRSDEPSILIYKNENGFFQQLEDAEEAFNLSNEMLIDLAVDHLQYQPIENELLYKTLVQACIDDQSRVGADFPYFRALENLPSHAKFAFIVINDGILPRGVTTPIYHCIAVTDFVERDFGCLYLTNDEQNIVYSPYNKEFNWFQARYFFGLNGGNITNKSLEFEKNKDKIKEAIAELNIDVDDWL